MPKYSQYPGESRSRFLARMKRNKLKDTNGDATTLKGVASTLSGSKKKSRRTNRRGRRRLYT
jgi:hypothetical protein